MRSEFEKLRNGSFFAKLCYVLLLLGHWLLPTGRREAIRCWIYRVTKLRPSFCRRVKKWGLNRKSRSPLVIVSLTSYPKLINTAHRTIETLLTQDFKPDMVILWLADSQFPRHELDLPRKLLRLKKFGLGIRWCKDIKSYKKLIPALRLFPDEIIVTADDDMFYRPEWLGVLYKSYLQERESVHCHYASKMKVVDGEIRPWCEWKLSARGNSSFRNSLWGGVGALYPPHVLSSEVLNEGAFDKLAPNADDLWFWLMAVRNGHRVKLADDAFCELVADWAVDKSEALMNTNVACGKNDVQLSNILKAYPEVKSRLLEAVAETKGV